MLTMWAQTSSVSNLHVFMVAGPKDPPNEWLTMAKKDL